MEHLIPPGQRVPLRIPNYQPRPDRDGNIATASDYVQLYEDVIKQQNAPSAFSKVECRALWVEHCRDGRVYSLCHSVLDQFYFRLIYQFFGGEVTISDFTIRDDDGAVNLYTAILDRCLSDWHARIELLDSDSRQAQIGDRIHGMLRQAAQVLVALSDFLRWSYDKVPVKQAYPDDDEPLGKTHFACVALHRSLVRAWAEVFAVGAAIPGELALYASTPPPWLEKLMEREGWCPYTISNLLGRADIEGSVYGYLAP